NTEFQSPLAAFRQGLRQLGWTEGQNLRIDVRWNDGDAVLARTYAAQLIEVLPDAILNATHFPAPDQAACPRSIARQGAHVAAAHDHGSPKEMEALREKLLSTLFPYTTLFRSQYGIPVALGSLQAGTAPVGMDRRPKSPHRRSLERRGCRARTDLCGAIDR